MPDVLIEALRAAAVRAEGLSGQSCDRGVELLIAPEGVMVSGWQAQWHGGPRVLRLRQVVSWGQLTETGTPDLLLDTEERVLARLAAGEGEIS